MRREAPSSDARELRLRPPAPRFPPHAPRTPALPPPFSRRGQASLFFALGPPDGATPAVVDGWTALLKGRFGTETDKKAFTPEDLAALLTAGAECIETRTRLAKEVCPGPRATSRPPAFPPRHRVGTLVGHLPRRVGTLAGKSPPRHRLVAPVPAPQSIADGVESLADARKRIGLLEKSEKNLANQVGELRAQLKLSSAAPHLVTYMGASPSVSGACPSTGLALGVRPTPHHPAPLSPHPLPPLVRVLQREATIIIDAPLGKQEVMVLVGGCAFHSRCHVVNYYFESRTYRQDVA